MSLICHHQPLRLHRVTPSTFNSSSYSFSFSVQLYPRLVGKQTIILLERNRVWNHIFLNITLSYVVVFVGAFLSMSSTDVFLMEKNSTNSLHGQVIIGTLILQDCAVGLLFAMLPVLGGTSGVMQGVISMTKILLLACCGMFSLLWNVILM